jgi:hypothetical protein
MQKNLKVKENIPFQVNTTVGRSNKMFDHLGKKTQDPKEHLVIKDEDSAKTYKNLQRFGIRK